MIAPPSRPDAFAPGPLRTLTIVQTPANLLHDVDEVIANPSTDGDPGGSRPFPAFIHGRHVGGRRHRLIADQMMECTCADGRPLPLATGLTWVEAGFPGTPVTTAR